MSQKEPFQTPMQRARKDLRYAIEQYGNACKDGNEVIQAEMLRETENAIGMLIVEAQLASIAGTKKK